MGSYDKTEYPPLKSIQKWFEQDLFSNHMGIQVVSAKPGVLVCALLARPNTRNGHGFVHGGALASLMDTSAGMLAHLEFERGCVTLTSSMEYLRPASASSHSIRSTSTLVRAGKSVVVTHTTLTDDENVVVATGTYTFFAKEGLKTGAQS